MDDLGDPPTTARWLAWATAILLIIGLVAAGVMNIAGHGGDDGVVTAAGRAGGTFDVPTTALLLPPPQAPAPPAPTVARITTVPKAAAAILKAIGSTTTSSTQPPTTTTTMPATTTTVKPAPTTTTTAPVTTTTSTTVPFRVPVTVANDLTQIFVVTIDGQPPEDVGLKPDTRRIEVVLPAGGGDVVEVHAKDDAACSVGDRGRLFQPGKAYRLTIVAGPGPACSGSAAPGIKLDLLP